MGKQAEHKAFIRRYVHLIETRDVDAALALAADDATFWHPSTGVTDKAAMRAGFTQIAVLMKTFQTQIRTMTAEENRVSVEVDAEIVFVNGNRYRNQYHFMYEILDGRITAVREYVDTKPLEAAFAGG